MMSEYVSFFGSIGVGKTTAGLEMTMRFPQMEFVRERLEDNPYLSRAYGDMEKWGFLSTLEMLLMMSRQFNHVTGNPELVILDNGIQELICYARLQRKLGILSKAQFDTYRQLNRRFLELTPPISLYVWFTCSEPIQRQRIIDRGRDYEQSIAPGFLRLLNEEYEYYAQEIPAERLIRVNTDNFSNYEGLGRELLTRMHCNKF